MLQTLEAHQIIARPVVSPFRFTIWHSNENPRVVHRIRLSELERCRLELNRVSVSSFTVNSLVHVPVSGGMYFT